MRLLIITQKVDRSDPILGFFHRWIEEFAKHCQQVTVIAQIVRDHHFPPNVATYSLGKEEQKPRILQILRFWKLLWRRRAEYDAALVHMTPIWVVLGWPFFFLTRKPVYLWYEARGARWPLKVALAIVNRVFSASKHGIPIATEKSMITGHGIDTEKFTVGIGVRDPHLVLTIGRISASKQLPFIVDTFARLSSDYKLLIGGITITPADIIVLQNIRQEISQQGIEKRVEIRGLSQSAVINSLQSGAIFLHASVTSLDKALLEAMACGCLVLSLAEPAQELLPPQCFCYPEDMASKAQALLALSEGEKEALRQELRAIVVKNHSLPRLIQRLVQEMAQAQPSTAA